MRKALITAGLILLWSLAVIALVFAEAFLIGPTGVPKGDFTAIESHLVKKLTDAAADRNLGSAALVLLQDGRIAGEHGFGIAKTETQAPVNTDQTLFQLASVSKAVTAWGIMKLVEQEKLVWMNR